MTLEDKRALLVLVERTRDDYGERYDKSLDRLCRLHGEKRGDNDRGFEGESRDVQKAELERRLRLLRVQQMSLQDAAVAAFGMPSLQDKYKTSSRKLEAKLRSQIRILSKRDFIDKHFAIVNLKRKEISQESNYGSRREDLYGNLIVLFRKMENEVLILQQQRTEIEETLEQHQPGYAI